MSMLCSCPSPITPPSSTSAQVPIAESGVLLLFRLTHHHADNSHLPRLFVKKAFKDGYEAEHIGLLCYAGLRFPLLTLIPEARGYTS